MEKLIKNVLVWAEEKHLLNPKNAKSQALKLCEECGEVAAEVIKNNHAALKLEIGDVMVTSIILAMQHEFTIEECLAAAWVKIENRKGKMVDGSFIKSE
jgi:NTP pyrophosphatase (non-canonical NTP hydrolase)